jgi:hypothetical protein
MGKLYAVLMVAAIVVATLYVVNRFKVGGGAASIGA